MSSTRRVPSLSLVTRSLGVDAAVVGAGAAGAAAAVVAAVAVAAAGSGAVAASAKQRPPGGQKRVVVAGLIHLEPAILYLFAVLSHLQ